MTIFGEQTQSFRTAFDVNLVRLVCSKNNSPTKMSFGFLVEFLVCHYAE